MGLLGNVPNYGLLDPYMSVLERQRAQMQHKFTAGQATPRGERAIESKAERAAKLAQLYEWANQSTQLRAQQDNAPIGTVGVPGGILPSNQRELVDEQVKAQQRQSAWDMASFATAPIPGLGDLVDLGAAANYSAANPGSAWGLGGLSAAALIPGLPFALGTFGGRNAKTAKKAAFDLADAMKAAGATDDEILQATAKLGQPIRTGFPDGMPRFEIDDSGFTLSPNYKQDAKGYKASGRVLSGNTTVSDFYGDMAEGVVKNNPGQFSSVDDLIPVKGLGTHNALTSGYPDLATVNADLLFKPDAGGMSGSYKSAMPELGMAEQIRLGAASPEDMASGTLHELQHAIQQREGFARGGNLNAFLPDDYVDMWPEEKMMANINATAKYNHLAGEAEARLVQNRMNLTADERLANPIKYGSKYGFDVPEADQIVRRGDGVAMSQDSLPMDEASRMARAREMGFDVDAYHGSTRDIKAMDSSQFGSAGGHYGAHNYFTDSTDDLKNYSGEGPDLTGRIEREAEQLADSVEDYDLVEYWKDKGVDIDADDLTIAQRNEAIHAMAKDALGIENKGVSYPVKLKGKNLVNVGTDNETFFDYRLEWDEAGEDIIDEGGKAIDLIDSTRYRMQEWQVDEHTQEAVLSALTERMADYEGLSASEFEDVIRSKVTDLYDDMTGDMASPGALISDIYREIGFDGVRQNAEASFGMRRGAMGVPIPGMEGVQGTNHYIMFDPKNVRSKFATFDPAKKDSANLMHGVGAAGAGGLLYNEEERKGLLNQ